MKPIMTPLLVVVAALGFAAIAVAKNRGAVVKTETVASRSRHIDARQTATNQRDWIRVSPARSLLGQELLSREGGRVGRVQAVMLDVSSGDAVFAIVSPQGVRITDADRLLIPFGALALQSWSEGPIRVEQSYDRIVQDSPRVSVNRLKDWMNRDRVAESYRRYGVPTPYGYVVPPDPSRERFPNRYLLVKPDRAPPRKERQADRTLADELRGAKVYKQNGDLVGDVDYVMLDVGSGRVAFVLLSAGKSLIPMPLQAATWSDRGLVASGAIAADAFQPLSSTGVPLGIGRSELETLYRRFDLHPYQQQGRIN